MYEYKVETYKVKEAAEKMNELAKESGLILPAVLKIRW